MYFLLFFLFLFFSCSDNISGDNEIYARVGTSVLTKDDVLKMKKEGLVGLNSIKNIVNSWVEKTLLYNEAININLNKDKTLLDKKDLFYKNLLIDSFLDMKSKKEVKISKKEISNYYKSNKKSFERNTAEVLLRHFVLPTKKEANKLKNLLRSSKKGEQLEKYMKKYKPEVKTIKKGLVNEDLIGFVFNGSAGDVLGPKKTGSFYHIFEILRKHNKGSVRGLELVYDEIQQRLFKIKELQFLNSFLDSIYQKTDIYISSEVNK
tara:strand:+ start:1075 stop:1863 length:789 start_codon:yes stop_codon:yes gene_type:complete